MKKSSRGFSLVELLVVISIISLLSSIVLATLGTMRMKARDAIRISDIRQIRTALELYYLDHNTYPESHGFIYSSDSSWDILQTALGPYLSSGVPKDPINTGQYPWSPSLNDYVYVYIYSPAVWFSDGHYDLVAQFEDKENPSGCKTKDAWMWGFHLSLCNWSPSVYTGETFK